ncbi:MAG: DNA polymerase III subunit beta [Gemmatimonadetes bacterium]|nr:DNA polymerase III subunit beta [Gemmatimonadota bacterium]
MHAAIADKHEEIAEICRQFEVERLEVFGSAARGTDFDPETSDVDFVVEFTRRGDPASLDQYFDFRDALCRSLERPVDLIESGTIRNPYLQEAIDKSRELIYVL